MTSVSSSPPTVSASAFSELSQALPAEGAILATAEALESDRLKAAVGESTIEGELSRKKDRAPGGRPRFGLEGIETTSR